MAIEKYKSFKDASNRLWVLEPDKDYYKQLKEKFEFWSRLSERKATKGIQKFRTFDEFLEMKNKFN